MLQYQCDIHLRQRILSFDKMPVMRSLSGVEAFKNKRSYVFQTPVLIKKESLGSWIFFTLSSLFLSKLEHPRNVACLTKPFGFYWSANMYTVETWSHTRSAWRWLAKLWCWTNPKRWHLTKIVSCILNSTLFTYSSLLDLRWQWQQHKYYSNDSSLWQAWKNSPLWYCNISKAISNQPLILFYSFARQRKSD